MRVGIIAEGPADVEVIVNILRGALGLDRADVEFLRPELGADDTDLHAPGVNRFSNWQIVREECEQGAKIQGFLGSPVDEERLVVIHIDSAECELPGFDVHRPARDGEGYPAALCGAIWQRMLEWLGNPPPGVCPAVAIEETDAWVLALFVEQDTTRFPDPKTRLDREEKKTNKLSDRDRKRMRGSIPERYRLLSEGFRKEKILREAAKHNASLAIFLRVLGSQTEERRASSGVG